MTTVDIPARTGPRQEQRTRRRGELLEAALRVIRREGESVAMQQIADEAGITRPILYRHFGDVAGLYDAIAERYAAELLDRAGRAGEAVPPGPALLRAQIDAYLSFLDDEPNLYRFLTRQFPAERPGGEERVRGFVQLVGARTAEYLVALDVPPDAAAAYGRAFVGAVQATGEWWLESGDVDRATVATQLTAFVWGGMRGLIGERSER